jgi:tRNA (Thr-GGU) A37 N-methylase
MSEGSEQDSQTHFVVNPVGRVESTLTDPAEAPSQGDEGAPSAWLVFDPDVYDAARDLQIGDRIIVIAWLHRAQRDVLRTFPRDWVDAPHIGIFKLRAPNRPNHIGLHPVEVLAI